MGSGLDAQTHAALATVLKELTAANPYVPTFNFSVRKSSPPILPSFFVFKKGQTLKNLLFGIIWLWGLWFLNRPLKTKRALLFGEN